MGNYLCNTWQGFIQQLVNLMSHGYRYYCVINLPEKKRDTWGNIDKKLIQKYSANMGKDKRYRRLLQGDANHIYLRWGNRALILRTPGRVLEADDVFFDLNDKPLLVRAGGTLQLKIVSTGIKGRCTVYIDKGVYREIKAELLNHVRYRRLDVVQKRFDVLDGIPRYSGITQQKAQLVTALIEAGAKHGLKLKRKDLHFQTALRKVKVFHDGSVVVQ